MTPPLKSLAVSENDQPSLDQQSSILDHEVIVQAPPLEVDYSKQLILFQNYLNDFQNTLAQTQLEASNILMQHGMKNPELTTKNNFCHDDVFSNEKSS